MGLFDGITSSLGIGLSGSTGSTSTSGTRTTKKNISQEAIDKILYDVFSSDQGLAALANAENASGGYKSSSKTLLAQDLIAKVTGEIANLTAETVETTSGSTKEKKGAVKTVICTHLAEQGYMPLPLYLRGTFAYFSLHPTVVRGYHFWAIPLVSLMKKHQWLCPILARVAIRRYEYIVSQKFSITGWISVHIAEPICYVIGLFVPGHPETEETTYG